LEQVLKFGELRDCRRKYLLQYFGENYQNKNCNACDLCLKLASAIEDKKYDHELFDLLKELRKQIADQLGMPPYVIFGNKTLQEMSTYFPQSSTTLLRITGVGNQKLAQFGQIFLDLIKQYSLRKGYKEELPKRELNLGMTHYQTLDLLNQKLSIEEIANRRTCVPGTIIDHIEKIVKKNPDLDIEYLRPDLKRLDKIKEAFEKSQTWNLTPARDLLGDEFSFDELRLARIFLQK